jgi:hypothetical protein
MSTGGGLAQLNTTLAMMDVPGMHRRMFTEIEDFIGSEIIITKQLAESMRETADEEKMHTISTGCIHHGIPAITVVVDGEWSKRRHKHPYNAKSGVTVIFWSYTNKFLFLGVLNKFCSVCATSTSKRAEVPQHKCYCNGSGSSSSMECDIIAEGFSLSESYMFAIHVGDR